MSWSKTACDTCARSCSASAHECDGIVYFFMNVRDFVLAAMGSFSGWIYCMFDCYVDLMFDLVLFPIGSWLPLEVAGTWVFLGMVIGCWCNTTLEFINLSLRWPPLDMDGRTYVCLCSTGGRFGNSMFVLGASVLQFPKIVWTD